MVRNYRFYLLTWLFAVMATGCSSSTPPPFLPNDYQYGNYYMRQMNYAINDKLVTAWEEQLRKDGGQIISVGQEYKLILPADILFYTNSPRVQWDSYALLNDVASYLRCFNKVEVQVTGITKATGNAMRDRALSMNRARNVETYLSGQEVGAGIIYIRGYVVTGQPSKVEVSFRSLMM